MSASKDKLRRKEQIADIKASRKKRESRKKRFAFIMKIVSFVIVAAIAVGIGYLIYVNSSAYCRNTVAVKIDDENISIAELNYYYKSAYQNVVQQYGDYASYFGLDTTKPLDEQDYPNNGETDEKMTWAEYFRSVAVQNVKTIVLLNKKAADEGIKLTDSDSKRIDEIIADVDEYCTTNKITVSAFLAGQYGKGVSRAFLRKILERQFISSTYDDKINGDFDTSDTAVDAYYAANKKDYLQADYRSYLLKVITPEYEDDATESEKSDLDKLALDAAKVKADAMLAKIKKEEDFNKQAIEYSVSDDDKKTYTDDKDASLKKAQIWSSQPEELQSWLFDNARKAGDKTVIKAADDTGYYVLYMVKTQYLDETKTADVRHILLSNNKAGDTPTDEEKKAAHDAAQVVYDEWLAGDKTEDSFAKLANEKSDDNNHAVTNGGSYTGIKPTDSYVAEFLNWCFANGRKTGDTGIVDTTYGAHIMYFSGYNSMVWRTNAKTALTDKLYDDFINDLLDTVKEEVNEKTLLKVK